MANLDRALEGREAPRVREILTELQRTEDRPGDFQEKMRAARTLAAALAENTSEAGYAALRKSCADCHRTWRNGPKEK
jgi:cytochrome c556